MTAKILGFAGSLRQGSYNRALLRTAVELVPADNSIEIFDLEGIPGGARAQYHLRLKE